MLASDAHALGTILSATKNKSNREVGKVAQWGKAFEHKP